MRAISPHGKYTLQLIESPVRRGPDASGTIVEWTENKPTIAEFEKQGLHPWEQVAALETFAFSGLAETVNPLSTLSVYDTEAQAEARNWTPEFKAQVEERLSHLATRHPGDFMVVPKPATLVPWPAYDDQTEDEIFATFKVTGFDPDVVRLYELENKNRERIVKAMVAILEHQPVEELDSTNHQVHQGRAGFVPSKGNAQEVLVSA